MNRNILFGFLFISVGLLGLYYVYAQGQAGLEIQRALEIAEAYTESLGEPDLHVAEIMEFKDEFYFPNRFFNTIRATTIVVEISANESLYLKSLRRKNSQSNGPLIIDLILGIAVNQ